MSTTTIESIQIAIHSEAAVAAVGINALAMSLGKLKTNGTVSVAVRNLNNLADALKKMTPVASNASKLNSLADAVTKLSSAGSFSKVINQLNKLPTALKGLESMKLDGIDSKFERIANAAGKLSGVKSGGLGTMVNALGKIGDVTKSLDDDTISRFADRVAKLNEKLTPLSQKMTTIQAGLRGVNSKAKSATSGVGGFAKKIDVTTLNMASMITVIQGWISAMRPVVNLITNAVTEAIEWDGVSARFGRGFGEQASEVYEWVQRLNKELGINTQQFMQYSSTFATMLSGFGVESKDASKMALGYMELTYDIWAGYNDIYQSLDDAATAVRSAIAGEVEPVRKAGFTIIESTLEQTAANHGLEISLEKATEAQKSYLRYLTLVDQAHAQGLVGNYARELNTAEGLMRTFNQQLKSLAQTFGSLFLPILVKIMPYIQAFVELLGDAIRAVADFFGITIQDVDWSGYGDSGLGSLGDAADSATGSLGDTSGAIDDVTDSLKDLKKATIGIDELNVISPPSNSSSSGGSGGSGGSGTGGLGGTAWDGLDIDSLWDDSIFADIGDQVDAIKEKFKEWLPLIELVAGALATLALVNFISSIGEAMSKMNLLQKALSSIAVATIEAALVFVFADNYLESGNLLYLVGEAVATAIGSYLLYKAWGPKGLVVGLAVSIAAQLAAITLNLAEGDVEMDDPQLWIQAAFTTILGGVAGGVLAYKGLIPVCGKRGVGLGLLVGLSLSLAAITIGQVTADGEATASSILTGLGSVAAAAGFGFSIGGPWGALIGAVVGLAITVGGSVIGAISTQTKKKMEADLKERFGEIELSAEMVDVYVDRITAIPREVTIDRETWNDELQKYEIQTVSVSVNAALDIYSTQIKNLKSLESQIEKDLQEIDTLNLKIALGMEVDPADYESAIDSYVADAQAYLDQFYLSTSVALEILGGDESLADTLNTFYTTNSAKLSELGARLKKTVSDAFVDGEWIPEKLNEAMELQQEIQEILDYVSDIEYRAKMQNLKLSVSGTDLTPESYKSVLEGAQTAIEDRLSALEEVKMSKLSVAIMEYDANIAAGMSEAEAKKIYDQTVADIETEYQNGRVEVTYGSVSFGLETLTEAFKSELANAKKNGLLDFGDSLDYALTFNAGVQLVFEDAAGEEIYGNMDLLVTNMQYHMDEASRSMSKEARENLESLLEAMKPTMADYEEIAAEGRKVGKALPENVRDGLNDYNELKALSGDVDGINYMIGAGFSTDTTFLHTLATCQDAGSQIDDSVAEGLLNNIQYVRDEATGVVTGIKNSVTGEVIAITPTLVDNMEQLGVDLSTGLADGVESDEPSLWQKFKDWCNGVIDWFKDLFDTHSPSEKTKKIGKDLSDGLAVGMEKTSIKDKLSDMWTSAKNWWDNTKGKMKSYVPDIGSIKDKIVSAWNSAKDWYNNKKTEMKKYTPDIGSIYEKVKTAWTNAKNWWNSKKGSLSYTPSIGSIKSKLQSAWSTAKSWWNKNVKLSIPSLSFKVTYTTSGLGSVKKAIVNALGLKGWPKLSFAKYGGMFDAGSLIWAGEAGAEIVANAGGGKTGVMNVDQMSDAVYEGVYAAVMAAMRASNGGSGEQNVNIYLDGKQITSVVEKRQRERGASIMGNQVYSY